MTQADPKLSTLRREQHALGELPAAERERHGAALEAELAALREDNAAILAAYPPAKIRAEVERRVAANRPAPRRLVWFGAPALAAAAVVLLVVVGPTGAPAPGPAADTFVPAADPGETRIKGLLPHLVVHRQDGEAAAPLVHDAEVRAGDVLQVSYVAAGAAHGVIVSIDGGGVVTLHFPADTAASTALQQAGAVRLDQAYELDDAPGFERFVLVTAAEALDPARVLAAAEDLSHAPDAAARPLALPAGWQQSSFLVRKGAP